MGRLGDEGRDLQQVIDIGLLGSAFPGLMNMHFAAASAAFSTAIHSFVIPCLQKVQLEALQSMRVTIKLSLGRMTSSMLDTRAYP